MRHKYVFIVELEGRTDGSREKKITGNAVNEFYREFFKDKKGILNFFRNLLYTYLSEGHHVFEEEDKEKLRESIILENKIIKPVLEKLPHESKEEILKILKSFDKETIFWEDFFESFSKFSINKMSFLSSDKENK